MLQTFVFIVFVFHLSIQVIDIFGGASCFFNKHFVTVQRNNEQNHRLFIIKTAAFSITIHTIYRIIQVGTVCGEAF